MAKCNAIKFNHFILSKLSFKQLFSWLTNPIRPTILFSWCGESIKGYDPLSEDQN